MSDNRDIGVKMSLKNKLTFSEFSDDLKKINDSLTDLHNKYSLSKGDIVEAFNLNKFVLGISASNIMNGLNTPLKSSLLSGCYRIQKST